MLTLQALQDLGVNTKEGLTRCINNEAFYLRMVKMAMADKEDHFGKLEAAIKANDLQAIHEHAHALKGAIGNVSLTPIYEPIAYISDQSKAGSQIDYAACYDSMKGSLDALRALCAD